MLLKTRCEFNLTLQHIIKEMRREGWSVDQHAFEDNTPFGKYTFTNVIATLNPDAPRRYSYLLLG